LDYIVHIFLDDFAKINAEICDDQYWKMA